MKVKFALTKLSNLAHELNIEASSIKFETGFPDEQIAEHFRRSQEIIDFTEAILGYMEEDQNMIEKKHAQLCEALAERNNDLRDSIKSDGRYKKRIKLLTNKLKRVSETQTKK